MKVAIIQRILPDFRFDLFKQLSKQRDISLRVFFGNGSEKGASKNTSRDYSNFGKNIHSIILHREKLRVFQPTLLFHLIKFSPDVIISEPATHFPNNFIAFAYAKLCKKPFIWWEIGMEREKYFLRKAIEPFIRKMILNSNAFLAYSNQAKNYLMTHYKINPDGIFVAHNTICNNPPIDHDEEDNTRKQLSIKKNDMVITYVGAIEKRKRLEIIFDSFKEISSLFSAHLLVIGDGIGEDVYKNYVKNIPNIHFLGRKDMQAVNKYLFISNYTVLPAEGGLAINHSLSCGTPVICGENDGTEKELIREGVTGIILKNINCGVLTKTLLTNHAFERHEIRNFYFVNFSMENMIQQIIRSVGFALERKHDEQSSISTP